MQSKKGETNPLTFDSIAVGDDPPGRLYRSNEEKQAACLDLSGVTGECFLTCEKYLL